MPAATKVALGLVALLLAAAAAGWYLMVYRPAADQHYAAPMVVPISNTSPSPAPLPAAVLLPVPYTDQAPLGDWAAGQHTCEEASLLMVDRYLRGDHSGSDIDPLSANAEIHLISGWKASLDLTDRQLGEMAQAHLGWAYLVLPADPAHIKEQLALGRPVIVGVRTHGLGNPNYPGYYTHHEQPGWSVSHYLVVVGYDTSNQLILNDPGLTSGHGTHISFEQLFFAIDDLDRAYPNLNQGRIVLVLAPPAA